MDELYQLPDGWEWKILSDCVSNPKKDIVDGPFGSNLKATEYINSGIPIIRLQNIQRFKFLNKDIKFVSNEKYEQLKRHTFIAGDIVITKLGVPLGKSCIVPEYMIQGVIVADVIRVRVDEKKTNKKYVQYVLNTQSSIEQFSDNSKGTTRKRVKLTMVRDLDIPLPPLEEQKRIVSKLDDTFSKLDRAIQLHQENIDEANAYMSSVLNEVFSELEKKYGVNKINTLFKIKSGKFLPKNKMVESGHINVYGGNGINGSHNEHNLSGENIVIGRVGALCGNVRYINENLWLTDNAFYIAEIMKDINKEYLTQMLIHIDLGSSANRSAQPVISYKGISTMSLPLPPIEEQKKVVEYLDDISSKMGKIKALQKEKLQDLKSLKASILDSAFRGEL